MAKERHLLALLLLKLCDGTLTKVYFVILLPFWFSVLKALKPLKNEINKL